MTKLAGLPLDGQQRRAFLRTGVLGVSGLLLAGSVPQTVWGEDRYSELLTEKYLGSAEIVATVEHAKIFTEGPAADKHGDLYFTNVPANQILKYSCSSKQLTIARENTNAANGIAWDGAGRLIACEGGTEDRGRVTRKDLVTNVSEVLIDQFDDAALGAPNDLCLDNLGRIYFTSRLSAPGKNVNSVYRIDPDGKVARILSAPDIDMPNGVDISPDDRFLYLIESDGRKDRARCIRRYELQKDGSLRIGRILVNFYPGRSGDGLCLDAAGNLYVAAGLHKTRGSSETLDTKPGIHVISPDGQLIGFVMTPVDTITNCAFGGNDLKTLFVTCGPYLIAIPATIPGFRRK